MTFQKMISIYFFIVLLSTISFFSYSWPWSAQEKEKMKKIEITSEDLRD